MIVRENGKYVVKTESGRVLGTHDTREAAVKQLQAVEISKHMNERIKGKR